MSCCRSVMVILAALPGIVSELLEDGKLVKPGNFTATVNFLGSRIRKVGLGHHRKAVLTFKAMAFSPDGKAVLTGSADPTARLWDAATGQPIGPPLEHRAAVDAVSFSPDGKAVLTTSADKTARLWDAATGPPIGPPLVHAQAVS